MILMIMIMIPNNQISVCLQNDKNAKAKLLKKSRMPQNIAHSIILHKVTKEQVIVGKGNIEMISTKSERVLCTKSN